MYLGVPSMAPEGVSSSFPDKARAMFSRWIPISAVEDRHELRVIQPRLRPGLAQKTLAHLGRQQGFRSRYLQGHGPIQEGVFRQVDDPEPTRSQHAQELKAAQLAGPRGRVKNQ